MKRLNLFLAIAALFLIASCSSDSTTAACATADSSVADTLDIDFESTLTDVSMTEVEDSSSPVGSDPIIFVAEETTEDAIEVIGAQNNTEVSGDTILGQFVILSLPSNTTAGTYTFADNGSTVGYAEDLTHISQMDHETPGPTPLFHI